MKQILAVVYIFIVLATACSPSPSPLPPTFDAGDAGLGDSAPLVTGDLNARACAKLRAFACPEGTSPGDSCEKVLERASDGTYSFNRECIAEANSVAEIRACGKVRCVIQGK